MPTELDYARRSILVAMLKPCDEMYRLGFWDKTRNGWKNAFHTVREFAIECGVITRAEAEANLGWDTLNLIDEIKRRIGVTP